MTETPRYRPRRLRNPDEAVEFTTTDHSRPADGFLRRPARRDGAAPAVGDPAVGDPAEGVTVDDDFTLAT